MQTVQKFFCFLLIFLLLTPNVFAVPGLTTYQAKIVKPDGNALESVGVNFRFTILNPAADCVLYIEDYSAVNMSGTGGVISFSLGTGTKTYPASATPTFADVFNNATPNLACQGGGASFTAAVNDVRKIVMQFNDGTGWQTLPAMNINAVPYAMYATRADNSTLFNNKADTAFVQYSSIPTCTTSQALQYTGTGFVCIAAGGGGASYTVTSGDVTSALGYTPVNPATLSTSYTSTASFSTVTATVNSLGSSVTTITSTVNDLSASYSALAAAVSGITSSQWSTSGAAISYGSGNVGIGVTTPVTKLEVSGAVKIGMDSSACAVGLAGTLRYNSSNIEFCNGTVWSAFGVAGAGITSFNGSTSATQTLANGVSGNAPAFTSANGIHTLNIPLASATGSVTAGLISNADYVNFSNKITSSSASIVQVLGYTPANSATVSALQNSLGTLATANSVDLGSASATGTLHEARLPSFVGITSGTQYTKVTVDGKGRVTSGSQLSASDVATALGYTPQASGSVSSQWTTSGTTINYITGYVGIGTSAPVALLDVSGDAKVNGLTLGRGAGDDISNTAFGREALRLNSSGWQNVAIGEYAMEESPSGMQNTALGSYAMRYDQGSTNNVAVGTYAMENNVNGSYNTAVGVFALDSNSMGNYNVAIGEQALLSNSTGNENVGVGTHSGVFNQTGSNNVLLGQSAGRGASGLSNYQNSTVIGYMAGYALRTAGSNNILLGYRAGDQLTTGANNIVIGHDIDTPTVTSSNFLTIGNLIFATGLNASGTAISTGNVGIGTTTPTAKLHLAAGTTSMAPFKFASGTLLTSPQSGTMEYDGANFYLTDGSGQRRAISTGSSSGTVDNVSNINSTGNIVMNPNGGTNSVIVSSTVASTSSNTGALVVNGGLGVAGNIYSSGTIVTSSNIQGVSVTATSGMISPYIAGSVNSGGSLTLDSTTHATKGNILLAPNGGNVGIGTSAPVAHLSIESSGATGIQIKKTAAAAIDTLNMINDMDATGYFWFAKGSAATTAPANANRLMGVTNEGNVEIYGQAVNATDKSGVLGLKTQASADGGTKNEVSMEFYADRTDLNTPSGYIGYENGTNFDLSLKNNKAGNLFLAVSGTSNLAINSSGYVGIGTTAQSSKLQVRQTASESPFRVDKSDGTSIMSIDWAGRITMDTNVNSTVPMLTVGNGNFAGRLLVLNGKTGNTNNLFEAKHNSIDKFVVTYTGATGIGTSAPSTTLNIVSSGTGTTRGLRIEATQTNANSVFAEAQFKTDAREWRMGVGGASETTYGVPGKFYIYDSNAVAMRMAVDTNGDVGIGTTDPQSKLHVQDGSILVAHSTTSPALHLQNEMANGKQFGLYSHSSNSGGVTRFIIKDIASGTERLIIDTNGNVGVGTSSPSVNFEVGSSTAGGGTMKLNRQNLTGAEGGELQFAPGTSGDDIFTIDNYQSGASQVFRFRSVANSSIMNITPGGNVGLSVANPTYLLQLGSDSAGKPGTTGWTITSDMRLKDSRAPFTRGINELLGLHTIYFTYKKNNPLGLPSDKEYVGIRAQDVQKVIPESVSIDKKGFLHFTNDAVFWTAVNAIKQLYYKVIGHDALLEKHEREIASVKAESAAKDQKIKQLEERLQKIEQSLEQKK